MSARNFDELLSSLTLRATWKTDAACSGVDTEWFYPVATTAGDTRAINAGRRYEELTVQAKQVCASCPVREQCLDYALRIEGDSPLGCRAGIFGGLGPAERHNLWLASKGSPDKPAKPPQMVSCAASDCERRFDANLTETGNRASPPRTYCSMACQRRTVSARNGAADPPRGAEWAARRRRIA